MIIKNPKFEISAVSSKQFPTSGFPEVAFVGRSNVGKSSIMNCLLNRKSLVKVGATPGKTRMINFFNIDEKIFFVDLPGYGYASVSRDSKANWAQIIEEYLNTRKTLKLIVMLVDIRHEPSNEDKMMFEWICSNNLPHIMVASKSDKITRAQISARLDSIKKSLKITDSENIMAFSSESKYGVKELWEIIDNYLFDDEKIDENS